MNILLRAYFRQKFPETWPKICLGQDPDLDVFEIRIRIRSKNIRIRNTANRYCTVSFEYTVRYHSAAHKIPLTFFNSEKYTVASMYCSHGHHYSCYLKGTVQRKLTGVLSGIN
jgi:hypothetical protein